jgi:restriction system protein
VNSEQYEHHVADVLAGEGWTTAVSRLSGDLGVDVVAERDGRRLAVQAKMYGGSATKVNAEQIMCLYGAAAYVDCREIMLATNGGLTSDARRVAEKLGVEVRQIPAERSAARAENPGSGTTGLSFGEIWETRVHPMTATGVARSTGRRMQVVAVDGAGVRRVTSTGVHQLIPIEIFRWAVERLLAGEEISRQDLRDRHAGRFSSAVMDILAAVPEFEGSREARRRVLRVRGDTGGAS